jgi:hypothetical protein
LTEADHPCVIDDPLSEPWVCELELLPPCDRDDLYSRVSVLVSDTSLVIVFDSLVSCVIELVSESSLLRVFVIPDDFSWLFDTASLIEFDMDLSSVMVIDFDRDFSSEFPMLREIEFELPLDLDEPSDLEKDSALLSEILYDSLTVVEIDLEIDRVQPEVPLGHETGCSDSINVGRPRPFRTTLSGRLSSEGW